jgi:hypothetical protein
VTATYPAVEAMLHVLANPLQMLLDLNSAVSQIVVRKRLTTLSYHPKNFSHGDARKTVKKPGNHHN